ncbi:MULTISPECIES: ATP-binding protein [unclassified Streptomyces]|uniref:ATP-binding protein n=1 Tax=unclassified Streptomyces TaxID=2593676 RepID=UPI002E342991|nr:ATP-binding protein [Streptomyces sp. NBC_01460]WSS27028.1 ATP-binding protein [Streptomyces sp. NBC_01185]
MSLPLSRRIARAALLIAAGAAPVVGAAGAAGAAGLPQTPALGGLTSLDGAGGTLDSTAKQGAEVANETGGKVVGTTLPAAGKTLEKAGDAAGGELSTDSLPTKGLPTKGLPIG